MKVLDTADDLFVVHNLLSLLYHSQLEDMDTYAFQGVYHLLNDVMERI